jgi:hypothetical protein
MFNNNEQWKDYILISLSLFVWQHIAGDKITKNSLKILLQLYYSNDFFVKTHSFLIKSKINNFDDFIAAMESEWKDYILISLSLLIWQHIAGDKIKTIFWYCYYSYIIVMIE